MLMSPSLRKFALTSHVTVSVGWFGAVAAFLALAMAGVMSEQQQLVRGVYVAMHAITWFVIVPFSVASLLTGLIQGLGTNWGLFRHHWVVTKLALTVVATAILLAHTQPIGQVAAFASESLMSGGDLRGVRIQLVADAGAALMALLVATSLSVYKPWGLTSYGRRMQVRTPQQQQSSGSPTRLWLWLVVFAVAIGLFLALHLSGGGMAGH